MFICKSGQRSSTYGQVIQMFSPDVVQILVFGGGSGEDHHVDSYPAAWLLAIKEEIFKTRKLLEPYSVLY